MNHLCVGDKVKIKVKEINEFGLLVDILGSENREGLLLDCKLHEKSAKTQKKYKVGSEHYATIVRTDQSNKFNDLELVKE